MSQFLDAALYYASLGWQVFPLAPGQKVPITAHGCKDATTDAKQINEWWAKWPQANIGLACGVGSGIYVLDIDVKEGINGFDSLKEFPSLPHTVRQDTPRGGAHYLYRSVVAPANRNSFRPGIDVRCEGYYIVLAPSTHPNGGVYVWSPGYAPWETTVSEFPEFMRPATKSPWGASTPDAPAVTIRQLNPTSHDVMQRASLYLAQCDPAVMGQCGHSRLLWAAVSLVHGFLLSDTQCFDLLVREYNPRCSPPWDLSIQKDHKDFCRKLSEARKLTPEKPAGWLLEDVAYQTPTTTVDVNSLLKGNLQTAPQGAVRGSLVELEERPVGPASYSFSQEREYQFLIRPTGLLGEICSWINATAIKEQPFLSLACSMTFLGAVFGRKVRDEMGSRTNLYCMGVAPSSAGKAHAMNQIRRLASASGCTLLLGGDDIASDSAIEDRVAREPATLFMWDEIGHLLAHIKSGISQHHAQVVSLLMKLYSAAGNIYLGKEYAEREKQRIIVQPCCSIYGTSTMERFTSGISPIELQDGWLSRCLVFHAPFDAPKKRGRKETSVPTLLADKVNSWFLRTVTPLLPPSLSTFVAPGCTSQPPEQIIVATNPDADRIFIDFDNESAEYGKTHQILACLWAKAEENARRIALIVACSETFTQPVVTAPVADYACRLIRYILLDFGVTVAPEIVTGDTDSKKRKILKAIDSFGARGCEKREVTKKTQELRKKDRNDLLDDLMEAGEIAFQPVQKSKVKTYHYWTAEHYAKHINA